MKESKQSEFSDQSDDDLMLSYYSESFDGSSYTSSHWILTVTVFAEPYLYEPVDAASASAESDDNERLHNSNWWSKCFFILVLNLRAILSVIACSSQMDIKYLSC